jgi:predicted GTPase
MSPKIHPESPTDAIPDLFKSAAALAELHGDQAQRQRLTAEAEHYRAQAVYVVIAGEAKRGKSSCANSLLDEVDLCPVDAPAVTNAPTVLRYGPVEQIRVHLGDPNGQEVRQIGRAQIREYITEQQNRSNIKQVTLLEIELPHPLLAEGMVLVDTPGLGTLNPLHAATTFSLAPNADAVLFVSSADRELTREEVSWAVKLVRRPTSFLYVLTHRDLVPASEWGAILEADVARLAEAFGCPPATIAAVAVSNPLKQHAATTGNEAELLRSGFPELEAKLRTLLGGAHDLLARRAAATILDVCGALRMPLAAEATSLVGATGEKIEHLRVQFVSERAKLEQFDEQREEWRQLVHQQSQLMQHACTRWLRDQFSALHRRIEDDYLNRPDELGALLGADIGRINADVIETARAELGQVRDRIIAKTELDLRPSPEQTSPDLNYALSGGMGMGIIDQVSTFGRGMAGDTIGFAGAGGAVGAILGGIAGTFVAPGVGTFGGAALGANTGAWFGGAVGSVIGFFRGFGNVAHAQRQQIKQVLYPHLNTLQSDLELSMRGAATHCVNALSVSFLQAVKERRKTLTQAIKRIEDARRATEEESQRRLAELNQSIAALDAVIRQASTVSGRPAPAASGPRPKPAQPGA